MEFVVWSQPALLAVTLLVVLWYTVETFRLRKEMVRQNKISLRPIVLPDFDIPARVFRLRNCGVGCALNVRVSPVRIPRDLAQGLGFGECECEIRFEPAYYMPSQERLPTPFSVWAGGQHVASGWLNDWFFPDRATRRISLRISFEDVEGRSYAVPVTIEGTAEQPGIPKSVVVGAIEETSS